MDDGLLVLVLDEVDDFFEFVQVHLLVLDKMENQVGVGLAVVLVHDISDGDAVILAFADGGFIQESIGNRASLEEFLFLQDADLFGDGGITRFGILEGIDQFPDAKLALLPEDIHDLLFLGRKFLFHSAYRLCPRANIGNIFKLRNFFVDFIIKNR